MMFTIFTPTYNRGYIITQLYESLINQTCKDFEWLVIDDGSTDSTKEIVRRFVEKDQRIHLYINERKQKNKETPVHRQPDAPGFCMALWFCVIARR